MGCGGRPARVSHLFTPVSQSSQSQCLCGEGLAVGKRNASMSRKPPNHARQRSSTAPLAAARRGPARRGALNFWSQQNFGGLGLSSTRLRPLQDSPEEKRPDPCWRRMLNMLCCRSAALVVQACRDSPPLFNTTFAPKADTDLRPPLDHWTHGASQAECDEFGIAVKHGHRGIGDNDKAQPDEQRARRLRRTELHHEPQGWRRKALRFARAMAGACAHRRHSTQLARATESTLRAISSPAILSRGALSHRARNARCERLAAPAHASCSMRPHNVT